MNAKSQIKAKQLRNIKRNLKASFNEINKIQCDNFKKISLKNSLFNPITFCSIAIPMSNLCIG